MLFMCFSQTHEAASTGSLATGATARCRAHKYHPSHAGPVQTYTGDVMENFKIITEAMPLSATKTATVLFAAGFDSTFRIAGRNSTWSKGHEYGDTSTETHSSSAPWSVQSHAARFRP